MRKFMVGTLIIGIIGFMFFKRVNDIDYYMF